MGTRINSTSSTAVQQAQMAASPPTKRDLASWWKQFKKNSKKEEEKGKCCPRFLSRTISMRSSHLELKSVRLATERLCRATSPSLITTPSWHHLHCYGFLESQNFYYIRTYASQLEAATALCSDVMRFGNCLFLKIGLATQGLILTFENPTT